ncbi:MAG TPA: family 16 glycoside hydrolase, partial [Gemmata sp.]|nr:family 16 glycoside hydrolase [Gemmata sp.]
MLDSQAAPMPVGEVVRIGREVARGLAAAHAIGVVHRDIKPENIWIEERTGRVRLLDFGLARIGADFPMEPPETPAPTKTVDGLTQVGTILGTPAYMAPEQARGGPVDHRADLFSLGCVLYHMLTGAFPFRGQTVREQVQALTAGAYVPIDPSLGVPLDLVDLVHRLLAAPLPDRPASAEVVARELLAIGTRLLVLAGGAAAVPVVEGSPAAQGAPAFEFVDPSHHVIPPRRSQVPLLLGTIAFIVVVMVLLSTQKMNRAAQPTPSVTQQPAQVVPHPTPNSLTRAGWLSPGYTSILPGKNLGGWRPANNGRMDAWSLSGEVLAASPKGNDQVLLSDREFGDFELVVEYRWLRRGGHTTVLVRAVDEGGPPCRGIPINIGDDEGFPAKHGRPIGALYESGTIQHATFDPSAANKPIGEWNELRVVAQGSVIQISINGVAMPTADLAHNPELLVRMPWYSRPHGSIGLVSHWGAIEFRHIAIKPLP